MSFIERLGITDSTAVIVISVSIMLIGGFLMTRITKKLRLPNVTAYIVCGILLGPYVLDVIPQSTIKGMDFISDIALSFIAFGTGEYFVFDKIKKDGSKIVVITIFESLLSSFLVFVVMYYVLKLNFFFSLILASLASATAPASTMMTIRQTKAKGEFVDTLLGVVAIDDVVALVAFSAALSIAEASTSGTLNPLSIIKPIIANLSVLFLGGAFGLLLKFLLRKRSTDNRLIVTVSLLFGFSGLCALLSVSPLLGCMSMGMVYINSTGDERLFKQLNYFSPPILLLFFVRSGLNFDLGSLFSGKESFGSSPLFIVGLVYFFVRIIGKYTGAFLGCTIVGKDKTITPYLGLALIPQAGVAIGLAFMGGRVLGVNGGAELETIILSSSVLYELIGPVSAKLSLYLSHSYVEKEEETKIERNNVQIIMES